MIFFVSNVYASTINTSVYPNPGYEKEQLTFTVQLAGSLNSEYDIKITLHDGEKWLSDNIMTPDSNRQTFTYDRKIENAGQDRKYRFGFFKNNSNTPEKINGTYWNEFTYTRL